MKGQIDWIRTVFFGAISGGFLWAIMLAVPLSVIHGVTTTRDFYTFVSATSIGIVIVGFTLYSRATTSLWRSTAVGIILAPLTGWSILLFVTLTVVLPRNGIY
ncbi:hypothetical protein [Mycobacterium montefiorense]|uniref:hypothetical protein n=1 Tax=Mycobacterium montefiorense TaxID=154654 RepID=UPI0021DD1576|nr:hypothetical protein [Mycobacterium montefiorense]MCV7425472.1 hypothetical protein [Mycobacterium montefiorense]GLE52416.1 hypothetical protein ATCCBAA256_19840 [Mycobacterium montefiorense]